jgi:hypothetical protein
MRIMTGLAVLAAAALCAQGTAPPPTLAVLPLRGVFQVPRRPSASNPAQGPRTFPLGEQLHQRIAMGLFATGRFQLIERSQFQALLKEGKMEQSGMVDEATAISLGKQFGAKVVILGSYSGGLSVAVDVKTHVFSKDTRDYFYPGKLEVRLRMVDTESGAIRDTFLLETTSQDPQASQSFEKLMDAFSQAFETELRKRYPLRGCLVKVISDQEVLIDLGKQQGLHAGDLFQAIEQGADVVHPVTGRLIPGERKVLGEFRVADVGMESSTLRLAGPRFPMKAGMLMERKAE